MSCSKTRCSSAERLFHAASNSCSLAALTKASISFFHGASSFGCEKADFPKSMGFRESKNRPVATNFQFLKILALLGQLLVGACLPQTLLRSECDILGIYLLLASVLSFPFFLRDKPKQRCVEPRQRNDEPRHNHTTAIELSFPLMKLISEAIYNRAEAA